VLLRSSELRPGYTRPGLLAGMTGLRKDLAIRLRCPGFTLVELLVVIAIVGTLLTIAVPRYFASVERSKEAVLKENLAVMRDAVQKYYGDKGKYPERLEELAAAKYLRRIPVDPMTSSSETWVTVPPKDSEKGGVYDVQSGASGKGLDGTAYAEW
jgi:general secretion pathway protein G